MKRFFILSAVLLAGLAACQNEIAAPEQAPAITTQYTLTVNAVKGVDTKALALSADGKTILSTWGQNDSVAVCLLDGAKPGLLVGTLYPSKVGEKETTLQGTIQLTDIPVGARLYLQYPHRTGYDNNNDYWPFVSYEYQNGSLDNVAEYFDYATSNVTVETLDTDSHVLTTTDAQFQNLQAMVGFSLLDGNDQSVEATKFVVHASSLAYRYWLTSHYVDQGTLIVEPDQPTGELVVSMHNNNYEGDVHIAEPHRLIALTADSVYVKTTPSVLFEDGNYYHANVHMKALHPDQFNENSTWTVIGKLTDYSVDWDNDLTMWTNGTGLVHVASNVSLKSGDVLKIRNNQGWDENFGGQSYDTPDLFQVYQDGANIEIHQDEGVYDIYLDLEAQAVAIVPAAGANKTSTLVQEPGKIWGIVGDMTGWADQQDIVMTKIGDGSWNATVTVDANSSFKLRADGDWAVNRGANSNTTHTAEIGVNFDVVQDGSDILISDAGTYIINYYPAKEQICINKPFEGWSITGSLSRHDITWGQDLDMTEVSDGVWKYSGLYLADSDEFKLRKSHDWADNRGGSFGSLGQPFDGIQGGDNIKVGMTGVYDVTLDLNNETILIEETEIWSLIGTLDKSNWDKDFDMTQISSSVWKISDVLITDSDEFIIRKNHDWQVIVSGPEQNANSNLGDYQVFKPVVGTAFTYSVGGGGNIMVGQLGEYDITLDLGAGTILIEQVGGFQDVDVTVYIGMRDANYTDSPNLYVWYTSSGNSLIDPWPGGVMNNYEEVNGIKYYKWVFGSSLVWDQEIGLIVNKGGMQTADFTVTIPSQTTEAWLEEVNGNIYAINGRPDEEMN